MENLINWRLLNEHQQFWVLLFPEMWQKEWLPWRKWPISVVYSWSVISSSAITDALVGHRQLSLEICFEPFYNFRAKMGLFLFIFHIMLWVLMYFWSFMAVSFVCSVSKDSSMEVLFLWSIDVCTDFAEYYRIVQEEQMVILTLHLMAYYTHSK